MLESVPCGQAGLTSPPAAAILPVSLPVEPQSRRIHLTHPRMRQSDRSGKASDVHA